MSNRQRQSTDCAICSRKVNIFQKVRGSDDVFHASCLVCSDCGNALQDAADFYPDKNTGEMLCKKDHFQREGRLCHGCSSLIEEDIIIKSRGKKEYHKKCFICRECLDTIQPDDTYDEYEEKLYCSNHRQSPETSRYGGLLGSEIPAKTVSRPRSRSPGAKSTQSTLSIKSTPVQTQTTPIEPMKYSLLSPAVNTLKRAESVPNGNIEPMSFSRNKSTGSQQQVLAQSEVKKREVRRKPVPTRPKSGTASDLSVLQPSRPRTATPELDQNYSQAQVRVTSYLNEPEYEDTADRTYSQPTPDRTYSQPTPDWSSIQDGAVTTSPIINRGRPPYPIPVDATYSPLPAVAAGQTLPAPPSPQTAPDWFSIQDRTASTPPTVGRGRPPYPVPTIAIDRRIPPYPVPFDQNTPPYLVLPVLPLRTDKQTTPSISPPPVDKSFASSPHNHRPVLPMHDLLAANLTTPYRVPATAPDGKVQELPLRRTGLPGARQRPLSLPEMHTMPRSPGMLHCDTRMRSPQTYAPAVETHTATHEPYVDAADVLSRKQQSPVAHNPEPVSPQAQAYKYAGMRHAVLPPDMVWVQKSRPDAAALTHEPYIRPASVVMPGVLPEISTAPHEPAYIASPPLQQFSFQQAYSSINQQQQSYSPVHQQQQQVHTMSPQLDSFQNYTQLPGAFQMNTASPGTWSRNAPPLPPKLPLAEVQGGFASETLRGNLLCLD
ncbi:hypothetical protein V1512DRAFT_264203 [Lipomyces arxii]|uniref:uncharacterized protein n=1 Tax=Lipomyces arxii TaxID=56418 RepID=UPI0034CE9230